MLSNIKKGLTLFITVIFLFPILLTGCTKDKTEIKEISAVLGIGIDKEYDDNPIVLTIEIANTQVSSANTETSTRSTKSTIQVCRGKTLFDAIENFSKISSTILDFSHVSIIILSKSFSESGISEMIDYMNRDREFRSINWVLVADKTAREILESRIANQDITSLGIDNMMRKFKKDPVLLPVDLNDFIANLQSESKTSVVPIVRLKKIASALNSEITIENMAVFKNDQYIGELSKDESKNYLWLVSKIKGRMIEFPFKLESQGKEASVLIHKKNSKIVPFLTDKGVRFQINCTGYADIKEVDDLDISPEAVAQIEYNTEIILRSKINKLINKSQKELDTDLPGFSVETFNEYPKKWRSMQKNWDDIFRNAEYDVIFDIDVTKIGLSKNIEFSKNQEGQKDDSSDNFSISTDMSD